MKFEFVKRTSILAIHHFHIDHNAPCLRLAKFCITIVFTLLGITVVPREIEDNGYVKFWGINKVL